MDTASLPKNTLANLYRFAWLLSGDAEHAEQALAAAIAELPKLEELRNAASRNGLLVQHVRQHCLREAPPTEAAPRLLRAEDGAEEPLEILEIEAYIVASRFQALPEPERTALALFYLPLLSQKESAVLLGLTLEQYCELLGRGRDALKASLRAMRQGNAGSTSTPAAAV